VRERSPQVADLALDVKAILPPIPIAGHPFLHFGIVTVLL